MSAWRLHISASHKPGRGAWAFRLRGPDGEQVDGEGPEPGASAWRLRLHATAAGLEQAPEGAAVEVRTSDETLTRTGQTWLAQWKAAGWRRDGGPLKEVDLLKRIDRAATGRRVRWTVLRARDGADDKAVVERARALMQAGEAAPVVPAAHAPVDPPVDGVELVGWTDGGCRRNPGPGGWGFVLVHCGTGATLLRRGADPETTNNRMELTAVLELLRSLKRPSRVELRADSRLVIDTCDKWLAGWKRRGWEKADGEPPSNLDLLQALDPELARHRIRWTWIRGHSGDSGNELADRLCNDAMDDLAAGRPADREDRLDGPPFGVPGVPVAAPR